MTLAAISGRPARLTTMNMVSDSAVLGYRISGGTSTEFLHQRWKEGLVSDANGIGGVCEDENESRVC